MIALRIQCDHGGRARIPGTTFELHLQRVRARLDEFVVDLRNAALCERCAVRLGERYVCDLVVLGDRNAGGKRLARESADHNYERSLLVANEILLQPEQARALIDQE